MKDYSINEIAIEIARLQRLEIQEDLPIWVMIRKMLRFAWALFITICIILIPIVILNAIAVFSVFKWILNIFG